MISKLIFSGYTGRKIKFELDKKLSLFQNRFFFEFEIKKKSSDTQYFKNQAQIDTAIDSDVNRKINVGCSQGLLPNNLAKIGNKI